MTLKTASVIGNVFDVNLLLAVYPVEFEKEKIYKTLTELVDLAVLDCIFDSLRRE